MLTPKATVVLVGGPMNTRLGPLPHFAATVVSSFVRSQKIGTFIAKIEKDDLLFMRELLESGRVKPVVDRTVALSEVRDALGYLGTTHARGKVVITV